MRLTAQKAWILKILVLGIFLFSLGFFSRKGLLTAFLENTLYKALVNESEVAEGLQLDLEPLGFFQLLSGEVRGVSLSAARLGFQGGPVFEDLSFTGKGVKLDLSDLLLGRGMEIQGFAQARLCFRLSEEELTAAIRLDLPQWEPKIRIRPEEIALEGRINVWNRGSLPFCATVRIEQAAANILRLTPTGLSVAGLDFLDGLLNRYRQELIWEYPIHLPWPLQISGLRLDHGFLEMEWKEQTMEGRE